MQSKHFGIVMVMNQIRRLWLAVATIVCMLTPVCAQPTSSEILPEACYWNLAQKLLVYHHELESKLKVTSAQLEKIAVMRASQEMALLFSPKNNRGKHFGMRDELFASHDDAVKEKLAQILDEKQMSLLRPSVLTQMFRAGYEPFQNRDLIGILSSDNKEFIRLKQKTDESFALYLKEMEKLRVDSAVKFAAELPDECRLLFVQYAGDKYFPGLPIDPNAEFKEIPFPPVVFSEATVFDISHGDKSFAIGPSATQLVGIRALEKELAPLQDFADVKKANEILRRELPALLTNSQLLRIGRVWANGQFETMPQATFSDPEVLRYLGMADEDAKAMMKFLNEETKAQDEKIAELNRRIFHRICDALPPEKAKSVRAFFAGTWE